MLQAVKANKVYDVTEEQAESYAANGYDIWEGGRIVRHAVGKTVPWPKYEEALEELDAIKKEVVALKAEIASLKAQRKKAKKAE